MKQAKITVNDRAVVPVANNLAQENGSAAAALELPDGTIVTGSTSDLLGPASAVLLNAIKVLGNIDKNTHLISRTFRLGIEHAYDIVEGPMADDQVWDYVEDYMAKVISKEAFWELVKFKYPTHQIVFCTERALQTLRFEGSESI